MLWLGVVAHPREARDPHIASVLMVKLLLSFPTTVPRLEGEVIEGIGRAAVPAERGGVE